MANLVAFGCSITYGHGLPDCFVPPDEHGPIPSEFAWPSLLGKRLEKNVINEAVPGSSNLEILLKILHYEFQPKDVCMVYWSFYSRVDLKRLELDPTKPHKLQLEEFEKSILAKPNYLKNMAMRNFLMIHHAALFLEEQGISYFFLDRSSLSIGAQIPNFLKTKRYDNTQSDLSFKIDLALDKMHPGIKSQEKIANYIHNKITQE
jgi:hypothetical protein